MSYLDNQRRTKTRRADRFLRGILEDDVAPGTPATIIDERDMDERYWDPNGKRAADNLRLSTRPATVLEVLRADTINTGHGLYIGAIYAVRVVDESNSREQWFARFGEWQDITRPAYEAFDKLVFGTPAVLYPNRRHIFYPHVASAVWLILGERQIDAAVVERRT